MSWVIKRSVVQLLGDGMINIRRKRRQLCLSELSLSSSGRGGNSCRVSPSVSEEWGGVGGSVDVGIGMGLVYHTGTGTGGTASGQIQHGTWTNISY